MELKRRLRGQYAAVLAMVVIMLFSVFCLASCTSEKSDVPEMSGQADIGTQDHSCLLYTSDAADEL